MAAASDIRSRYFQENLTLLSNILPRVGEQLRCCDDTPWTLCETRQGQPNLCRQVDATVQALHSVVDAVREAESWWQGLSLQNVDVLFVYGIGLACP